MAQDYRDGLAERLGELEGRVGEIVSTAELQSIVRELIEVVALIYMNSKDFDATRLAKED